MTNEDKMEIRIGCQGGYAQRFFIVNFENGLENTDGVIRLLNTKACAKISAITRLSETIQDIFLESKL